MKTELLLSWILAWVQIRDATPLSIRVWCDAPQSLTTTHTAVAVYGTSANITTVDQFISNHKDKIHDYCLRHCCSLGTCNVETVEKSENESTCLVYGSYAKETCTFKRAAGDEVCSKNISVTTLGATVHNYTLFPEIASNFTVKPTSVPKVTPSATRALHDESPHSTATEPTPTTARDVLAHDEAWRQLFKLLASPVKARKGVDFYAGTTIEPTTTASKDAAYNETNKTMQHGPSLEHATIPSTPTTQTVTADTKQNFKGKTNTVTTLSSTPGTPVFNLKVKSRTTTPVLEATTNPTTTTSTEAAKVTWTTTLPATNIRKTTTSDLPTTGPTATAPSTVLLPTSASTSAPPLWETMFTQSSHSSSTEETTAAVSEPLQVEFHKPLASTPPKDTAPVHVHAQTTLVLDVGSNGGSAPMGLVVGLSLGLVFVFIVLGVVGRQILDLWQRRHYSRMDFLVDGMYH